MSLRLLRISRPPSSLVVVGKASAFIEPLKEDFPDIRLIAESELDLNRADLVKPK